MPGLARARRRFVAGVEGRVVGRSGGHESFVAPRGRPAALTTGAIVLQTVGKFERFVLASSPVWLVVHLPGQIVFVLPAL